MGKLGLLPPEYRRLKCNLIEVYKTMREMAKMGKDNSKAGNVKCIDLKYEGECLKNLREARLRHVLASVQRAVTGRWWKQIQQEFLRGGWMVTGTGQELREMGHWQANGFSLDWHYGHADVAG